MEELAASKQGTKNEDSIMTSGVVEGRQGIICSAVCLADTWKFVSGSAVCNWPYWSATKRDVADEQPLQQCTSGSSVDNMTTGSYRQPTVSRPHQTHRCAQWYIIRASQPLSSPPSPSRAVKTRSLQVNKKKSQPALCHYVNEALPQRGSGVAVDTPTTLLFYGLAVS